jgi:hypothetical protein
MLVCHSGAKHRVITSIRAGVPEWWLADTRILYCHQQYIATCLFVTAVLNAGSSFLLRLVFQSEYRLCFFESCLIRHALTVNQVLRRTFPLGKRKVAPLIIDFAAFHETKKFIILESVLQHLLKYYTTLSRFQSLLHNNFQCHFARKTGY